jgi:hypothetical protein
VIETVVSIVLGTGGLTLAALGAATLSARREPGKKAGPEAARLRVAVQVCLIVQALHFIEESVTGFHAQFPRLLGLPPWPTWFFIAFNVFWLAIWALAARRLGTGRRLAWFAVWFLGIAMVLNGLAHPLLALRVWGYFPGLITAIPVGVAGLWLLRWLVRLTVPVPQGPRRHAPIEVIR